MILTIDQLFFRDWDLAYQLYNALIFVLILCELRNQIVGDLLPVQMPEIPVYLSHTLEKLVILHPKTHSYHHSVKFSLTCLKDMSRED